MDSKTTHFTAKKQKEEMGQGGNSLLWEQASSDLKTSLASTSLPSANHATPGMSVLYPGLWGTPKIQIIADEYRVDLHIWKNYGMLAALCL